MIQHSGQTFGLRLRSAASVLTFLMLAAVVAIGIGADVQAASGSGPPDPLPGASPSKKINRQVDLFARMIDNTLVESEHALVSRGRNATGAYVPNQGALFAFEFSLVGGWTMAGPQLSYLHVLGDLDDSLIELEDLKELKDLKDLDLDELKKQGKDEEIEKKLRAAKAEASVRQTEQYQNVKAELVDMLAQYGDLLDEIPGDEWVTLIARPSRGDWGEKDVTKLVMRVRRRDVTDRVDEKIDDAAFRKRFVVEEYSG